MARPPKLSRSMSLEAVRTNAFTLEVGDQRSLRIEHEGDLILELITVPDAGRLNYESLGAPEAEPLDQDQDSRSRRVVARNRPHRPVLPGCGPLGKTWP
jgi:hypothetical protein